MRGRSRSEKTNKARRSERVRRGEDAARDRQRRVGPGRRRPSARWPLVAAGALVIGVGGYLGRDRLRPAPAVVVPAELEQLEPQLQAYLKSFLERVRQAPREAQSHATLGLVYEANELWPQARSCFQNAVRLDPKQPLARYHLAIATLEVGDRAAAIALLEGLTKRFPDFAPGYHRLGVELLETGAIEEATSAFERVIALEPREHAGYVGLADAKLRVRDFAGAAELLEKALDLKPDDGTARHLLGEAYRGLGRVDDARRELGRAANAGAVMMIDPWTRQLPEHAKGLSRQTRRALAHMNAGNHATAAELLAVSRSLWKSA